MGVRKTTDFVEKATWNLAIIIMLLSLASVFVGHQENKGQQGSPVNQSLDNTPQVTTEFEVPMQQPVEQSSPVTSGTPIEQAQ